MAIRSLLFALPLMLLLLSVGDMQGSITAPVQFKTVGKLLQDLEENTPSKGLDYKTSNVGIGGSSTAYGHPTCRPGVDHDSCTKCVAILSSRMLLVSSIYLQQHPF